MKRSRVKSKQRSQETHKRVDELKIRNEVLEEKIKNKQKNLKFLKELFLEQAQAKTERLKNIDLKKILEDDDDDEANNKSTESTSQPSSSRSKR